MVAQRVETKPQDFYQPYTMGPTLVRVITGLALAAITGYIAYQCVLTGLHRLDLAYTTSQEALGYFLAGMGVVYTAAFVFDCFYVGSAFCCKILDPTSLEEWPDRIEMVSLIACNIFAPLAAVPIVLCCALDTAFTSRILHR